MNNLKIDQIDIKLLNLAEYNPRKWDKDKVEQLKESIEKFGMVDPLIVNGSKARRNVVIGGHFRLHVAKLLKYESVPVVYINIPDINREKELNIRLNKNTGDWDYKLLTEFDPSLLANIGFSSEELDDVFGLDETPEIFDLEKELAKLDIKKIQIKKRDVIRLGDSKLMCGDSTVESDVLKLMGNDKADMCLTDPPYILDYRRRQETL